MDEHLLRFNKDKTILFIDVETENLCLHTPYNYPWQVAMIKVVGDKIVQKWDWLVRWPRPINVGDGARFVTGFRDDLYEELAVDYQSVVETTVKEMIAADYVAGHNFLGFDIYPMLYFGKIQGVDLSSLAEKIIDTNAIAKGIKIPVTYDRTTESLAEYQYKLVHKRVKGLKTNLTALGKELKIDHDYDNLHNALVDLELNIKVWDKLKFQIEI